MTSNNTMNSFLRSVVSVIVVDVCDSIVFNASSSVVLINNKVISLCEE